MINRAKFLNQIRESIASNPVTAIVGPRQSGKTTIAREIAKEFSAVGDVHYFDLERMDDLFSLEAPQLALQNLKGLIIIDEIQRKPDLFPLLRVFSDRMPLDAKFLILGSASGKLLHQSSESLAGRIEYIELEGFGLDEVEPDLQDQLWIRGGYPRSFLSENQSRSFRWREQFIQTFLEKDIAAFDLKVLPLQIKRFWQMIAHYHGQTCNYSEIGRSLGITHYMVKYYLDLLSDTFMIRQLTPWFENVSKSMVKASKIYIRDSGLLHALLDIESLDQLRRHPKIGASWEGFALEQVIRLNNKSHRAFFWATHGGAEMDLVITIGGERLGFEFKYADAPKKTKSMVIAMNAINLSKVYVVYPGVKPYYLDERIQAVPLSYLRELFNVS